MELPLPTPTARRWIVSVLRKRSADKWGITLTGSADASPTIAAIRADGLAANAVRNGELGVGMALVAVNGRRVYGHAEGTAALVNAKGKIELEICEVAEAAESAPMARGARTAPAEAASRKPPPLPPPFDEPPAVPPAPSGGDAAEHAARPSAKHAAKEAGRRAAKGGAKEHGDGGWRTRHTVDGGVYYHNIHSDEVCWEKPVALQSAAERQTDSSDCVWVGDGAGSWAAAYVLRRTAHKLRVRTVDGGKDREIKIGAEVTYPLQLKVRRAMRSTPRAARHAPRARARPSPTVPRARTARRAAG